MGVLRAVGVVLALAAASVAPGTAASAAFVEPDASAASHPSGLFYAALGDSYASGLGLPPYTNQPVEGCFQSAENYAHRVASEWELQLSDSSCSGAVAANIADEPQQTGEATAPRQVDALNSDTEVVTVTIGGNDLGFAGIVGYCTALTAEGPIMGDPQLDDCRSHFWPAAGIDILQQRLRQVVAPAVHAALAGITAAAPNAVVIVVGYPAITPDPAHTPAGGCFRPALEPASGSPGAGGGSFAENAFPFTDVDVPYLHNVEAELNDTLKRQAEAVGARYIDVFAGSQAHSACAAASEAYVNGLTLRRLGAMSATPVPESGAAGQPQADIGVKPGGLHPNSAGVAYLADRVRTAMEDAFHAPPSTSPTPRASPPSDTPKEWTFPLDFSQPAVIGIVAVLLVAGVFGTTLWQRRRQEQNQEQEAESSRRKADRDARP